MEESPAHTTRRHRRIGRVPKEFFPAKKPLLLLLPSSSSAQVSDPLLHSPLFPIKALLNLLPALQGGRVGSEEAPATLPSFPYSSSGVGTRRRRKKTKKRPIHLTRIPPGRRTREGEKSTVTK